MKSFLSLIKHPGTDVRRAIAVASLVSVASSGLANDRELHRQRSVSAPVADNSVETQLASFQVAPGYEVNLLADEKDGIANPICMNWDPAGRLWVLCSEAYPQLDPEGDADDRLLVLEDTNRDGRADKTTVFARGLNMPTGFAFGHGGVYLGEGPDLIHLSDTDGDGKADARRLIFTGFGTGDTHQNINSFTWSPGGELLFCQGLHAFSRVETPWGIRRLDEHGSWRYRPLRGQLDGYSRTCSGGNPWGIVFGNWGEAFIKSNGPGFGELIPAMVRTEKPGIQGGSEVEIGRTEIKSMILEIPESPHLPEDIQGDILIAGYFARVIDRVRLSPDGAGHQTENLPPLLTTTHNSFRPVDLRVGPDGALYVADWYNPIIGHYQASLRHPDRDKDHGRVWRITAKDRPLASAPDLSGMGADGLCRQLESDWRYVRQQAKRCLADLSADEAIPAVAKWVKGLDAKAKTYERSLFEAIGVYESHETPNRELLERLLVAKDPGARAYAARVAGRWSDRIEEPLTLLAKAVADPAPRVRMEALVACSEIESADAILVAAKALEHPTDRFIGHVLTSTARARDGIWLSGVADGSLRFENVEALAYFLRAQGGPEGIAAVRQLLEDDDLNAEARSSLADLLAQNGGPMDLEWVFAQAMTEPAWLDILVSSARRRGMRPAGDVVMPLRQLLAHESIEVQRNALELAGRWKVAAVGNQVLALLSDREQAARVRATALSAYARLAGPKALAELEAGLEDKSGSVRVAALEALATLDLEKAGKQGARLLVRGPGEAEVASLVRPFTRDPKGLPALAAGLKGEEVSPEMASQIRGALATAGKFHPSIDAALRPAAEAQVVGIPEYSESYVQQLGADVKLHGDAANGAKIYHSVALGCVACHQLGKEGGVIGPELTAVGAGVPVDLLIEAVLWPQRQIKEGYFSTVVATKGGETINGYLISEDKQQLVLKDAATGQRKTIRRQDITQLQKPGSLMPLGLTAGLSRADLRDLVRFLAEQKGSGIEPAPSAD